MQEHQLKFPFLQRETFFSGRSMVQLKLSFPDYFNVFAGIYDQCLLPLEPVSQEEAGRQCVTENMLRDKKSCKKRSRKMSSRQLFHE